MLKRILKCIILLMYKFVKKFANCLLRHKSHGYYNDVLFLVFIGMIPGMANGYQHISEPEYVLQDSVYISEGVK